MNKIAANHLRFKTFRHLKVNETQIAIPELKKMDYSIPSDMDIPKNFEEFENIEYGISDEAYDINRKYLNLYKRYENEKDSKDFNRFLELELNDDNNQLFDLHDIVAEENSHMKIVLDYTSCGEIQKFKNTYIRILAKKNAKVDVFVIEREDKNMISLQSIGVIAMEDADVCVRQYQIGATKLCANYACELLGERANSKVKSIYFGNEEDELNIIYNMIHRGKRTNSDMVINGALKDSAYKNFKMNLDFKEGCIESTGKEEEFALVLDDTAKSISVPLMLCHEDDVEGNHAASVGRIEPEVLFYIMTRGIPLEEAENLIVESKFAETIDEIDDENLKEKVWNKVKQMLKAGK